MLLKAYAKVNLVLKVLGKNDYNYQLWQSHDPSRKNS